MTPENEHLANRIDAALTKAGVPAQFRRWGEHLAQHLRRPVSILVTGKAGTGKALLVRLLSSGLAGVPLAPFSVTFTNAPLPQDLAAFLRLIDGKDIVVWCSTGFCEHEQRIWTSAPDGLRDHSFLVLHGDNTAAEQTQANGLFRAVHSVDLQCAAAALSTGNGQLWQTCGMADLQSSLKRQVAQGTEADIDQALVFLAQFEKTKAQEHSPARNDRAQPARTALEEADHLLATIGEDLNRRANQQALTPAVILTSCLDTARAIQGVLTKDISTPAEIGKLAAEGEKAIHGLVRSNAATATLDAITVLLQLRKEIRNAAYSGH